MMQLFQMLTTYIPQFNPLEQVPNAFVWIQIGCIRRQLLQMNCGGCTLSQKLLDRCCPVNGGAIPDGQQPWPQVLLELFEKVHAFGTRQSRRADQGIQATIQRQAAHHRQMVMGQRHFQQRRFAARGIRSDNGG